MRFISIEKKDGKIYINKKNSYLKKLGRDLLPSIFVTLLGIIVLGVVLGILSVPVSIGNTIIKIFAVTVFAILYLVPRREVKIILDPKGRVIRWKKQLYEVSGESAIILRRKLRKKVTRSGAGDDRRTYTTYIADWQMLVDDCLILKYRKISGGQFSYINFYSLPWLEEMAEYIAEVMQLPLHDETGEKKVIREVGETDISLGEYLLKYEPDLVSVPDESLSSNYFQVEKGEDKYKIKIIDWYFHAGWTILFVIFALLGILYLVEIITQDPVKLIDGFTIIFLVCIVILLNLSKRRFIIEIDPEKIRVVYKGIFWVTGRSDIPLKEIEKMTTMKTFNKGHAIELISDQGRYYITGSLDPEEQNNLELILKTIIAKVT